MGRQQAALCLQAALPGKSSLQVKPGESDQLFFGPIEKIYSIVLFFLIHYNGI